MARFILCFFTFLFISFPVSAENFVAKVNRNQVPLGETFVLTLQYDGNPGNATPDFSPLEKDFTIYSVGRDYQRSSINGKVSHIYQWNVALAPKVSGVAVIPSIAFRSFASQPIKIKVADETISGSNVPRFSIGRYIDKKNPLVQEQIIYTLVIKTPEQIQGSLPQFSDGGSDWIIKQLGQPTEVSEIDNGIEVHKIEIKYAMFPQKSGRLTIPALNFNGYYWDKNKMSSRNFSGMFNAFVDESFLSDFGAMSGMQRINLSAKPIEVDVRPIPNANNGYWWLPSSNIEISSDWDKQIPQFKAGEAVNRKITLTAVGVSEAQMPKIEFKETTGLKQYPEKPAIESIATDKGLVSVVNVNIVYIPEKGGQLTIPEISIPWYNISTAKMEKTFLPELQVQVKGVAAVSPVIEKENSAIAAKSLPATVKKTDVKNISTASQNLSLKHIIAIAVMAFALGLLASWGLLSYHKKETNTPKQSLPKENKEKKNFQSGIYSSDLKIVRCTVLEWAEKVYPERNIRNLDDVAKLFNNEELSFILRKLDAALYSPYKENFDAEKLLLLMKKLSREKKGSKEKISPLPELYK